MFEEHNKMVRDLAKKNEREFLEFRWVLSSLVFEMKAENRCDANPCVELEKILGKRCAHFSTNLSRTLNSHM